MTNRKERLTVTVDPEWVAAGSEAVAAGRADSLSAWVNTALAERVTKERRLLAMAAAVAAYEREFGEISAEEMAAQARKDLENAVVTGSRGRAHRRGVA
ncbi:MAG: hypothetical protein HYV07_09135 [Deltaproteobacteria bacterium]|nr:hypothetical protein [Deltaproteobacteria bacterium]